jgi:hypothetical protein
MAPAKGYSIQLVSASPVPGTKVAVAQTVEFKLTVSYQLSFADKGSIVLVIQDENNKNLLAGKPEQSQSVDRSKGSVSVTLTESFVVPAGSNEVCLFVPLVPAGLEHTDEELVLRYPVSNEMQNSTIGYPTVAAALADLHSNPEVKFREEHGWASAEDSSHHTFWSFPPAGDPAYPSAVRRVAVQDGAGISMHMEVMCESTQSARDKLVKDFNELNERARDSFKKK